MTDPESLDLFINVVSRRQFKQLTCVLWCNLFDLTRLIVHCNNSIIFLNGYVSQSRAEVSLQFDHQDLWDKCCYQRRMAQWEEKRFRCSYFKNLFLDDIENGDDDSNEANGINKEDQTDEVSGSVSAGESVKDEDEEPISSGPSPLSDESKSLISPLSDPPSPRHSPSQSEPMQTDNHTQLSNGNLAGLEEPVDSSNQVSVVLVSTSEDTKDPGDVTAADSRVPPPLLPAVIIEKCPTQTTTNGTSPPPSPRTTRAKRKREETSGNSQNTKCINTCDRYVRLCWHDIEKICQKIFTSGSLWNVFSFIDVTKQETRS